ncbi:MAG: hypothetical protein ABR597_09485 [Bacteroidales bacterium]
MNFNLITDHPWWFLLLCLLLGYAVSALLYYRNTSDDFSILQKRLLGAFRFIVISLLAVFLLSPLLKMQVNRTQEPIILFFQDNSRSLTVGADSMQMKEQYSGNINGLFSELRKDYSVNTYAFGEEVREQSSFNFLDKQTDISEIFATIDSRYTNRNIGALVIASDGIFNRGKNPLYQSSSMRAPVYTLALGDTLPARDLLIQNLRHNRITYLNNIFPVEITVEARQSAGESSRVMISHDGRTVFEQRIDFTSDAHFESIVAELEATETGIKRYKVEIESLQNEITLANNAQEFFIEVIDSRQKILIMAWSPHPDVGALNQALQENDNYEVDVALINEFEGNLGAYNLVIWHQIPNRQQRDLSLLTRALRENMAQLFIFGSQSNFTGFNRLQTGIQINLRADGFNDSRAEINENFNLFRTDEDLGRLLPLLPPLNTPFANYNLSPSTQVFAYQRIGAVSTQYPLIALSEVGERKTALIAGEGIWRWRLGNFAREGNHNAFNNFVSSMVQYLSVVEDKSFFRVQTPAFIFENQPVIFDAELYNKSYELVNEPDINLTIVNEDGVEFDYIPGRTGNAYTLNAGAFPVGEYTYQASVEFGGETFTAEGFFTVSPLNIESINTVADHNLLFQLAQNSGAEMFYPDQTEDLLNNIRNREDIRPVIYSQNEFEDLINLRWIFFLLLTLLTVEWFIRKYAGSY